MCSIGRPSFWDLNGRSKWDAWFKLGNMSKEEAMSYYIKESLPILSNLAEVSESDVIFDSLNVINVAKKELSFESISDQSSDKYSPNLSLKHFSVENIPNYSKDNLTEQISFFEADSPTPSFFADNSDIPDIDPLHSPPMTAHAGSPYSTMRTIDLNLSSSAPKSLQELKQNQFHLTQAEINKITNAVVSLTAEKIEQLEIKIKLLDEKLLQFVARYEKLEAEKNENKKKFEESKKKYSNNGTVFLVRVKLFNI
ncbi:hypothetical protein HK096_005703 [Nowakowskiella sp. JEL0078]|nr:hypothetical protein HK096_005703 [Nowakowskiella sp. JEL0078]